MLPPSSSPFWEPNVRSLGLYGRRLAELAEQYASQGVVFAGIDANRQDTLTEVADYAARYKIEFPMLLDADHKAADLLGAARTPEVFVLDANRVIRYHGRVDDQYGIGIQRTEPERQDLAIALDEILAGKAVSVPQTPVMGCIIGRQRKVEPHGEITYASHVAEILNRRCVECHRDGEIAPFSLTSFEDIAGWEAMIAEVVTENRMPPWTASPEYGHFSNDARLTPRRKDDAADLDRERLSAGRPGRDSGAARSSPKAGGSPNRIR